MNYWSLIATPLICIPLISIPLIYQGYKYGKRRLEEYIVQRVMEDLDRRMKIEEEEQLFKPIHSNSAQIKVKHGGKTHSVYVPYNRKKSTSMLRKRVYLIKDGEKLNISQKPGIPYLICADDLGGESIIIENLDGDIVRTYKKDEVPNFY